MSKLEIVHYQMDHLIETVLPNLDKVATAIPVGQLEFRPTPENMSAKELVYHIYQVALVLTRGVEMGSCSEKDLEEIPFDPDRVDSPEDLLDYGSRVRGYLRSATGRLRESDLERQVDFFGRRLTGFDGLALVMKEAIHHRGQLMLYLRLMGNVPPRISDFS